MFARAKENQTLRTIVRLAAVAAAGALYLAATAATETTQTASSTQNIEADLQGIFLTKAAQPDLSHDTEIMGRLRPLMFQQASYLIGTMKPWDKDPRALSMTPCGSGEHDIRPNTHAAYGLAVMSRFVKTGWPAGLSPEICRDKTVALLRFVLPSHGAGAVTCSNGKLWHSQWQSALWAYEAGKAAWILWDDLDPKMRWLAANMICEEADRFIDKKPPTQVESDTKAEENAWDSTVIALAYNMFPNHPHRAAWEDAAIRWAMSSFATSKDVESTRIVDSRPMCDWLTGPTIHDDYTLENHDRVHPDYTHTYNLTMYQSLVYLWGGNKPPEALFLNGQKLNDNLKKLSTPDGSYIYPNGQDWGLHRNPDWMGAHAAIALFMKDRLAARLWRNCVDASEVMAKRDPKGGIFLPEEYFFPSTQQFLLDTMADNYLLCAQLGDGPTPVTQEEFDTAMLGLHMFTPGKFAVMRSPKGISSFSWGRRVMGVAMPYQKDIMISPYERSMVGSIAGKGIQKESPKVREAVVQELGSAFGVAGVLERAGGMLEQRFAFIALPDGRTVYIDKVLATSATKDAMTLHLGTIAVANEPRWAYHGGDRTIYLDGGHRVFSCLSAASTETVVFPKSPWFNIDDRLGVVPVDCTGRAEYAPTCDVRAGRIEQLFHLNAQQIEAQPAGGSAPVAVTALVFYPGQEHKQTAAAATKCALSGSKATGSYTLTLDDGSVFTIDLAKLAVKKQ